MGLWGVVSGEGKEGEWENGKVKGFLSGGLPVIYLDKVDEVGLDKSSMNSAKVVILYAGMDMRWTLHMEETWRAVLIQVLAALA
jgi:hypothetical protein